VPRRIEAHLLDGPSGKLEALLEPPEDGEPRAAALVCHPHPLFGGTLHNITRCDRRVSTTVRLSALFFLAVGRNKCVGVRRL
jgi:alpha/beta superfamily hydrolase